MNVTLTNRTSGAKLSPTTPIVFGDCGEIYINPVILEANGEDVIFEVKAMLWGDEKVEKLGKAVTVVTLTVEETLKLAKRVGSYDVRVNNKLFARDRRGSFCAGFTKQRGYRIWLLPVSDEDAKGIIAGTKKIVYYTYNRGAKVIAA